MSDGQIGNPSKVGLQPFAEAASFRVPTLAIDAHVHPLRIGSKADKH